MRKLVLLAAILVMLLLIAAPAMGQITAGDNSNACGADIEQTQQGNIDNELQSIDQTNTTSDDNEIAGNEIGVDAEVPVDCTQNVEQYGAG
jgi:hypothetical protein